MNSEQEKGLPATKKSRNHASGSDFVAGLVILLVTVYTLIESIRMPYYEEGERGLLSSPGLTPGLLSAGLILMALALMFRNFRFRFTFQFKKPTIETWRILSVLIILVAYVGLMKPVGYIFTTFLMLASFQFIFARKQDLKYILIFCIGLSALVTGILFYVFGIIFMIPLP